MHTLGVKDGSPWASNCPNWPLGVAALRGACTCHSVELMISIHEILSMHANWVASLAHSGLDEATLAQLAAEVSRTNRLSGALRSESDLLDSSLLQSIGDLDLSISACETAIAQLQVLLALAEEMSSSRDNHRTSKEEVRCALIQVQATRDSIASKRSAAVLTKQLIAEARAVTCSSDGGPAAAKPKASPARVSPSEAPPSSDAA